MVHSISFTLGVWAKIVSEAKTKLDWVALEEEGVNLLSRTEAPSYEMFRSSLRIEESLKVVLSLKAPARKPKWMAFWSKLA